MLAHPIRLTSINELQTLFSKDALIFAIGKDKKLVEIAFPRSDALKLGLAALYLGVSEATNTKIPIGSKIPEVIIPVMNWTCGTVVANGEPCLTLEIPGGAKLLFQFPWQAAHKCGQALAEQGLSAAPAEGTKPS